MSLVWSSHTIRAAGAGLIARDTTAAASHKVALVLGCAAALSSGERNLYFEHRMDAAAELWRSGKAKFLLVSGDNHRASYDEPTQMMAALVRRGVPENVIVRDFAGFRTLDSIVRAQQVFGESRFCIVSQEDHLLRALYVAKSRGIEATGFAAADVPLSAGLRTKVREVFARLQAVLDVNLLNRNPRFPGPRITIGAETE